MTRRLSLRLALVAMATLASIAGCKSYQNVEINTQKYPIGNSPSPACIDAAKRATYWCEHGRAYPGPAVEGECNKARWDHAREC
jgi:hypothetical protein